MENSQNTLPRKASIKGFPGTLGTHKKEDKTHSRPKPPSHSYQRNYGIGFMEERLFHLKTQTIIDELTQIMTFIKELERFWFGNSEVLNQIHIILMKLRSEDRSYKYTRVVHVLTKYLSGIREFSSNTHAKGVIFYKKLIESTLVAIIRELDTLEEEMS